MEADQTVNINDGNSQNFFFFTPSQLRLEQSGLFIYKSAPHCLNILTHCEEDLFSLNFFLSKLVPLHMQRLHSTYTVCRASDFSKL